MPKPLFTGQEQKVLKLICRQYTNKQIAEKMGLSYRTVEDYRTRILKKTKAKNVVGVVLYALKHGHFTIR